MNPAAVLELKLLSETIFGGEDRSYGSADIEVKADEHGFPYFPGRTLKGMLREQAEWYADCLEQAGSDKSAAVRRVIEDLFGRRGEENWYGLHIGNASFHSELYRWAKETGESPQAVFAALTDVRTMTSLDDQTGTVKNKSLRQVRVVRPGFTFTAPLYRRGGITAEELEVLATAAKLLRRVGLMRSRGKGEVVCRVIPISEKRTELPSPSSRHGHAPYYRLTIELQEPLKISSVRGTSDSSTALDYIPGSMIRGALIHAYLRDRGMAPEDLDTRRLFQSDYLQFWNGYREIAGERGLPFARNLFEPKAQARTQIAVRHVWNGLDPEKMAEIRDRSPVQLKRQVMALRSDQVITAGRVKASSTLHLSVNGSGTGETHLYRYEAIASGQRFQAVIWASPEADTDFMDWLKSQIRLQLWIGGARNSGYGRTEVRIEPCLASPEALWTPDDEQGDRLYVYAASDWLIRHPETGAWTTCLPSEWLGKQLGLQLELEDQHVGTRLSSGYVAPWKAYQPAVQAVEAGSVFSYRILSGKLNPDRLTDLMSKGIGDRRNEGYGRLLFLADWPYIEIVDEDADLISVQTFHGSQPSQATHELDALRNRMLAARMEGVIQTAVLKWIDKLTGVAETTMAQWGNLLSVASEVWTIPDKRPSGDAKRKQWRQYWEEMKARTENKSELGIWKAKIDRKTLAEFTDQVLRDKWTDLPAEDDSAQVYWSMRALELFFRQIVRRGEASGKETELR
jgi:CRISPR-associated protein Csx10